MRREDVVKLLVEEGPGAVAERALASPRVLRLVVGRLWEADPRVRAAAAASLGEVAARAPERGRELVRRFLWALNDESATSGGPVLPALREIGLRNPGLVTPHAGALARLARIDEALRPEIERTLSALREGGDGAPGTR